MKIILFISGFFVSVFTFGQIALEKKIPYPENDFVTYQFYEDKNLSTQFEIGRFEIKDHKILQNQSGEFVYKPIEENQKTNSIYDNQLVWIYLKVSTKNTTSYFSLEEMYDVDLFQFENLNSPKILLIKNRYAFYLFDLDEFTFSEKQIPGLNQYEGEDAISGLIDAFTLFDEEKFLLGFAQGFGIFCFDISHLSKPKELIQKSEIISDEKKNYLFYLKNKSKVISAEVDPQNKSKNIENFYLKLSNIHYLKNK